MSTWMDEDFIGKVCSLAKGVDARSLGLRVLQRYAALLEFMTGDAGRASG